MMRLPGGDRRAGFTLIELLVVLLILSVVAGATVPALLGERPPDNELTAAARKVETLFRLAHDSAIHSRMPVTVVIDSATALVWLLTEPRSGGAAEPSRGDPPNVMGPAVASSTSAVASVAIAASEGGTSLELPASVDLEIGATRARFTFLPTGAAMADSLVLRRGAARLVLTLDPWTGDVLAR